MPQVTTPRSSSQKAATTVKREQIFIEEDSSQNIPIDEEIPYLNPVIKPKKVIEPEIPYLNPVTKSQDITYLNHVIKEEEVPFLNTVVKPEQQEVPTSCTSPRVQELSPVASSSISSPVQDITVSSRKRSARLMSKESTSSHVVEMFSDEESDSGDERQHRSGKKLPGGKRQRRDSSVGSSVSHGKRSIKSEYTEDREDSSSIAGSASEWKYHELRHRNNEASRRSRQNRKSKETEMEQKANILSSENRRLHSKVDRLEHLVHTLRKALLDSVTRANKNNNK